MIIKLKYRYYSKRDLTRRKNQFNIKDLVEGTYDFDTEHYYNTTNNYYNVVREFLQSNGAEDIYLLTIIKVEEDE